jgi:hypothetical protein
MPEPIYITPEQWHAGQYWLDVEIIAEQCQKLYPDEDDGRRQDYIGDAVEDSDWIANGIESVLSYTYNQPSPKEVEAKADPTKGERGLRVVAATLAMERDIEEKLCELDELDYPDHPPTHAPPF